MECSFGTNTTTPKTRKRLVKPQTEIALAELSPTIYNDSNKQEVNRVANQQHLDLLKQGVETWNQWRRVAADVRPDLSGADLSGAHLSGAHLYGTDLTQANLTQANLSGADLTQANLNEANLSKADVGWTRFVDVDLSVVKGLETVKHFGPSSIGIDTIYRSHGAIPEVFLREAGVPDTFLTYMHSLVGQPFEYFSCFISHSSKDKGFCGRLYADLQANHVRSWYFPEDARWGEPIWGEIDRSIKVYDKLIVVCSEHSLQSIPVQREMERALSREDQEHKNILFPIRIDNYLFECWEHPRKADVAAKVVGDFRGWNRNAAKYDAALKKLLSALRAQE